MPTQKERQAVLENPTKGKPPGYFVGEEPTEKELRRLKRLLKFMREHKIKERARKRARRKRIWKRP